MKCHIKQGEFSSHLDPPFAWRLPYVIHGARSSVTIIFGCVCFWGFPARLHRSKSVFVDGLYNNFLSRQKKDPTFPAGKWFLVPDPGLESYYNYTTILLSILYYYTTTGAVQSSAVQSSGNRFLGADVHFVFIFLFISLLLLLLLLSKNEPFCSFEIWSTDQSIDFT